MTEEKKDVVSTDASATQDEAQCSGGSFTKRACCAGKKSAWLWVVLLVLAALAVWAYVREAKAPTASGDGTESTVPSKKVTGKKADHVRERVKSLIDGKLLQPGTEFELGDVTEESGLYKIQIKVAGQEVASYMTKDMDKFIPELLTTKQLDELDPAEAPAPAKTEVTTKTDKPVVEVFVMSHCPYGTQIEKGIIPVFRALGNKIDAQVKFVNYAMHDEKELVEQMRQYCIMTKEPQKFYDYLDCFLVSNGLAEDATACMQKTGISQQVNAQCVQATDAQYKVMAQFKDKSTWQGGSFPPFDIHKADNEKYNVQGSPTLIINGEEIQSNRDSQSLLNAICSAFTTAPEECQKELPAAQPAPGFGTATAAVGGAVDNGSC